MKAIQLSSLPPALRAQLEPAAPSPSTASTPAVRDSVAAVGVVSRRTMNKEESAFERQLAMLKAQGMVQWYEFEPMKFRLANDTTYTPDFVVVRNDGRVEAIDVKALWKGKRGKPDRVGWQEDARVKVKVAATLFPWIRFCGAHRDRAGKWQFEEFNV